MIEKLLQSQGKLVLDQSFEIHVATVQIPTGGRGTKLVNLVADLAAKTSVVVIRNDDNMCVARAIVVGQAHINGGAEYLAVQRTHGIIVKPNWPASYAYEPMSLNSRRLRWPTFQNSNKLLTSK